MRDYAKVEPKMWHGATMKALRKCPEGVIVGMYLMTSPQSNMLGLFSQPVLYMAHETGLGLEGATKGLQHCINVGFCSFDEDSEFVWVQEMAKYQIAPELKATDLRCKGIQKDYDGLPDNPYLGAFFDRYAAVFHLTNRRGIGGASPTPSKPLRSQEQEQEQEQEQAQDEKPGAAAPLPPAAPTATGDQPLLTLVGEEAPAETPPCPLKQLVGMYVARLPELPKPRYELWKDGDGAEATRQRWKWLLSKAATREDGSRYAENAAQALDWFGRYFDAVAASDLLMGRKGKWRADLAWLMKRENFTKVVQGNYENRDEA